MTTVTPPPPDDGDEMLVPRTDSADAPQAMEVVGPQTENVSTVENQVVEDPPPFKFSWTVENFSRLNTKKHYSEVFVSGGYKWRVLVFPKGNNVDFLSMYLDVADSTSLPYGWSRYAQFSLTVINQMDSRYTIRKEAHHQFNVRESDWGFTSFMPLSELYDPSRGYLVDDTFIVEAEVTVRKVFNYWAHDSKKETGYVGIKNQGATCYMNSLLQTLYHIPYFRKSVYHMPTTENDIPTGSIPLALQNLFYKLQYSERSVGTRELTKSFGWDTYDSFMQHDVQELNRVLSEKLEDKMKGTVVEGTIQHLFEGHHMSYIECINVDYKSTRKESFYDLQLDVKGCRDVYDSFDKYVEVERLEGDNKYRAEKHGLQDAKKGVLFIDFPPVLQLQLKRFEYDFMRDTMVKINDRYEFPLQLDLDRENGKYLSPEADRRTRNLYTLHSVLVHSGGVHGGHYYAFIRPMLCDKWFKFDDERVTKEDAKRACEDQFGGEEELPQANPGFNSAPFRFTKYSNAYMLVYIRESDKEKIMCSVDEKDIAEHLRVRFKKEQELKEHRRKEKFEAHLYTIIKVSRNEDLVQQIGKDMYFDLVDHDKVHSFRIQKQRRRELGFVEGMAEVEAGETEVASQQQQGGESNDKPHRLERKWTFWFDNQSKPKQGAAWGASLRKAYTFDTVEEFWCLYDQIFRPSKLLVNAEFHCFRAGIEPKWEDPECAEGGKWSLVLNRKSDLESMWLETLMALIGEQFDESEEICGVVASVRQRQNKLALWTKNASNEALQTSIGRKWKEIIDFTDNITYNFHDAAKREKPGSRSSRYTV